MVNVNQEATGANFSVFDLTRPGLQTPELLHSGVNALST